MKTRSEIGLVVIWLAIFILVGYNTVNLATMLGPDMVELRAEAPGKGEP